MLWDFNEEEEVASDGTEAAQGGTRKVSQDARYLNRVLNDHSVSTGREHLGNM